jgi:chaperonin cofactor prefoldin
MEEQSSHAKRKHYDRQTYARLLNELTKLMEEVPKLRPDRNAWDIEGDWAATGTVYFVDIIHQPLFETIRGFDCRTIKLVNMDRPAIRITFYRKHRYWLLKGKDLPSDQKVEQIQAHINDLTEKAQILESKLDKMPASKQAEAKGQISSYWEQVNTWCTILATPEHYEIAVSNYSRQHFYVTVNYKYRLPSGDFTNEQEHLLNTQRDRLGNITQVRYNILFVDPIEILRDHPYQNREVEGYLNNFPIKAEAGRQTIYARLRPEIDTLKSYTSIDKI